MRDMSTEIRREAGVYYPADESEVVSLVTRARAERRLLRVRGSGHSWAPAIEPPPSRAPDALSVSVDRLDALRFELDPDAQAPAEREHVKERYLAVCGAGIRVGFDPYDPNHRSTWQNGLNYQLNTRNLALPDLGGISHQTVAGFLATGSSGGSLKYSVHDAIASVRLVDGTGAARTLSMDHDADLFRAAGVSMGLLGVVTEVTLRPEPSFNIEGTESISETSKSPQLDLYGLGDRDRPSLWEFLRREDYARLMWWPQRNFDRLTVWRASRVAPTKDFCARPYHEIAVLPVTSQCLASVLFTLLGNLDTPEKLPGAMRSLRATMGARDTVADLLRRLSTLLMPKPPSAPPIFWLIPGGVLALQLLQRAQPTGPWREGAVTNGALWFHFVSAAVWGVDMLLRGAMDTALARPFCALLRGIVPYVIDRILSVFVSTGPDGTAAVQRFQDVWYLGLPMDNQMDDVLMNTWFTELWIPIDSPARCAEVMQALRRYFDADGTAAGQYKATGYFSVEIYAAKRDERFDLHCASGADVLRVDIFWFAYNGGDPHAFYEGIWEALKPFGYRLHWGKIQPREPDIAWRRAQFPRWDAFMDARRAMDPDGVFLSPYWRTQLGV